MKILINIYQPNDVLIFEYFILGSTRNGKECT